MNPIDYMYKFLIKQSGVLGKVNGVSCKFLITENQDSNTNGEDLLTISTDQPLEQGYYINVGTDTYLVVDKKTETKHYQSYNVGSILKCNHVNKFVDITDNAIYAIPSVCTNVTKGKLNILVQTVGITEASGVWSFIAPYTPTTKKITVGKRFLINGQAWETTSLDYTTDEGILYVIMKVGTISQEFDDIPNEVADGKRIVVHNYGITLNSSSASKYYNETYQLISTCTMDGATQTNPTVTYTSSNTSVASVSSSGLVTTLSKTGSAIITATYKNVSTTFTINVSEKPHIFTITIDNSQSLLYVGDTLQLNVTCKDNDTIVSSPTITYSSLDSSVATISTNGLITSLKQGTTTINATFNGVIATFDLSVNVHTYSITLNETSKTIINGGTYQIEATCIKDSVTQTSPVIVYSSSDTSIANVDSLGEVTTLGVGNVAITCTYEGVNATLNIQVDPVPVVHNYTISLAETTGSIIQGNTYQLNAVCKDNDVTVVNPIIAYSTSDSNIVTVDTNGLITSINVGSCTITGTFEGASATFSLTVNEPPHTYTIALNSSSQSLGTGTTYQIVPSCTDNGTNVSSPVVVYTSSDTAIATVSTTGLVSAIASGSATITATYQGQSATLNLTVTHTAVTTFSYTLSNGTNFRLKEGSTITCSRQLDAVADPTYTGGGLIAYTLDSIGASALSAGKMTVTKSATLPTISVRNTQTSSDTVKTIHITVTDVASGTIIVNNLAMTLKNGTV